MKADPIDGQIREALAEVISRAPLAPTFDDITPAPPRRQRTVLIAAVAAAAVLVLVIGGLALAGSADTIVSTDTANRNGDPSEAAPENVAGEPRLRVVDGTAGLDWGMQIADRLASGTCGFDTHLVQNPPTPPLNTRVVATEEFAEVGARVAAIIGTDLSTVTEPTIYRGESIDQWSSQQGEDGYLADIVVELGPDFSIEQIDTRSCPMDNIWPTPGPAPPDTPPLLTLDFEQPDGTTGTARFDVLFGGTDDSRGTDADVCVTLPSGSGCSEIADPAQLPKYLFGTLSRPAGGTAADTERIIAVAGPGETATLEVTDGVHTSAAAAQLLPEPYTDRAVTVISVSPEIGEDSILIARDADGNELARRDLAFVTEADLPGLEQPAGP